MDGMVGQHRDEQVRADTGVGAMPDRAQAEFGLQFVEKHATESHKEGESAIKWTRPHLL